MLQTEDWAKAQNIVAKRYIEDVIPKVYFDDVKLQMDSKLWAEQYNRYNPPKKVYAHTCKRYVKLSVQKHEVET